MDRNSAHNVQQDMWTTYENPYNYGYYPDLNDDNFFDSFTELGTPKPMDITDKTVYKCPPKPNIKANRVLTKTYYNHEFDIANCLQPYQVHTFYLDGVDYFFASPYKGLPTKIIDLAFHPLVHTFSDRIKEDGLSRYRDSCSIQEILCVRVNKQRSRIQKRRQQSIYLLTQTQSNRYKILFSKTTEGAALRSTIRAVHRNLYWSGLGGLKRKTCYITTGEEFIQLMKKDGGAISSDDHCRWKQNHRRTEDKWKEIAFHSSGEFTYTLLADGVFHISRADTTLRDVASKHLLHAECEPVVVYAGMCRFEMRDGENHITFVVDNDSGTYAPTDERNELARLKSLLEWNFEGLHVDTKKFVPPAKETARNALEEMYALAFRYPITAHENKLDY
ncbi:unnamed protein product [Didymodactylos carnosus]|uniref:Uncharacterized protein n=1 Tax=Didymodactylos carnosus TaxID=1234261 RepID=A0A815NZP6_9BILA|nr:unnamed protein product [Didymodactylos carnosus]CAF4317946.1 unnamed protein product [Didymodactylos carnosus]